LLLAIQDVVLYMSFKLFH